MTAAWEPLFQTTIDAYYAGDLGGGLQACERLLSLPSLPETTRLQTRRNLVFYAARFSDLAPSFAEAAIEIPVAKGWSRYNPSIANGPHGLAMIVRSANYAMTPKLEYSINDGEGVVRTTNFFVELDAALRMGAVREIDDREFRPDPPLFPVAGFEDCRLVWHRGAWWASATVRDRDPSGVCQMALLRLEDATPRELRLLTDGITRHEKNWMPLAGDKDVLRFVYSLSPTVLLRYDDASGAVVRETERVAPEVARSFSGGTQAIPVEGGRLSLIHDGVRFDDGGRVYLHRWVWFDADWRLARLSPPFRFQELGVEFAAGLARRGDELVVSYGRWDREAWLVTVDIDEVLELLAPPLDPAEVEEELADAPLVSAAESLLAADARSTVSANPDSGLATSSESPTIVSTTLTGNSGEIIGDALRSVVDWVDVILVIDTGITDNTLEIARDIAGSKLVVRQFPWRDDFAAARNFALEAAAELGADWAVTLDSDERLVIDESEICAALSATGADSLHVKQVNGTYGKERIFRLPARGRYVGPTHEAFIREGGNAEVLDGMLFAELGKTHEQYRQKAERDIAILTRHTAEHPDDPRWFYYLGDSLAGLGRHDEAIVAFRVCASLNGWDEESAWAMYRAAECLLKIDRPAEAIEACAVGMARHAGLGELPWLAGFAAWRAGRPAQAVYWARASITMGHFQGNGGSVPRIGFRHPPGLWEGPFDVLRFALRQLGDEAGADEAEQAFAAAMSARIAAGL